MPQFAKYPIRGDRIWTWWNVLGVWWVSLTQATSRPRIKIAAAEKWPIILEAPSQRERVSLTYLTAWKWPCLKIQCQNFRQHWILCFGGLFGHYNDRQIAIIICSPLMYFVIDSESLYTIAGLWLPAPWLMQRMSAGNQTELHVWMIWLMVQCEPDANDWHGNQGSRVSSRVE